MEDKNIFGMATDGTKFTAESPEVVAFLEKYPDVTLEVAIGSVIMEYNKKEYEARQQISDSEKQEVYQLDETQPVESN
jgi:hypothetical protein